MKSSLVPLAIAAALLGARAARADEPAKQTLVLREVWKPGDAVTHAEHETKHEGQKVEVGDTVLQEKSEDTETEGEWVVRCDAADAKGSITKGVAYFSSWTQTKGTEKDTSLQGVVLDLGQKTWTARGDAKLSDAAKGWLDEKFGPKSKGGADDFGPPGPVAVGETWKISNEKLAATFGDDLKFDAEKSEATAKLEAFEAGRATIALKIDLATKDLGGIVWTEGGHFVMNGTIAGPADGTPSGHEGEMEFALKGTGTVTTPQGDAKVTLDVHGKMTGHAKAGGSIPEAK